MLSITDCNCLGLSSYLHSPHAHARVFALDQ